jgi:hypothetical protein
MHISLKENSSRPPKNGNLLRQRKNPDRLCMRNTPRVLDFFASLHLTIFERPASFEFFGQSAWRHPDPQCSRTREASKDFPPAPDLQEA